MSVVERTKLAAKINDFSRMELSPVTDLGFERNLLG
jgi:hypothetical protein